MCQLLCSHSTSLGLTYKKLTRLFFLLIPIFLLLVGRASFLPRFVYLSQAGKKVETELMKKGRWGEAKKKYYWGGKIRSTKLRKQANFRQGGHCRNVFQSRGASPSVLKFLQGPGCLGAGGPGTACRAARREGCLPGATCCQLLIHQLPWTTPPSLITCLNRTQKRGSVVRKPSGGVYVLLVEESIWPFFLRHVR